ncbi:MAG: hypothetical protein HZB53_07580 [Chloroflexi bacterium]|nr:hypothetical protein [Chloroflexota bacterium]
MNSPTTTPADLAQALQTLRFIDEERRKEKLVMADLQKRLDEQKELIVGLGRRIESLETRVTTAHNAAARVDGFESNLQQLRAAQGRQIEQVETRLNTMQASLYRFDQIEANLAQTRAEANALVDKFDHQLHEALDQSAQARAIERERDTRALHEIRVQLDSLPDIARRLDTLALEDRRLNDLFPPLRIDIEKLSAALVEVKPRMQFLEEWGERLTAQIGDLKQIEARIKAEHATMLETLRRNEENLRQQLVQFSGELAEYRRQVDGTLGGLPPLAELYEQARRVLAHFEGLDEELRADQERVAHLIEINEQRMKEALAEYRSDYEKNWEQHLVSFDLYRTQQRDLSDAVGARLDALEAEDAEHAERWHALREAWGEQAKRQLLELERTRDELEAGAGGRKRRRNAAL